MDKHDNKRLKAHVQFAVIPPLDDIKEFFTAATDRAFIIETTWAAWLDVDVDDILCFQPYIRPSHQQILRETAQGVRNACSLLRQLLRPYGYCITYYRTQWKLEEIKNESKTVGKKEGIIVKWSG